MVTRVLLLELYAVKGDFDMEFTSSFFNLKNGVDSIDNVTRQTKLRSQ